MTVQAIRRINWLLGRYENPKYLEIGVSHGKTFLEIEAAQKVAVDPKFQFDMPAPQEGVSFHQMTSDEYFERHAGNDIFDVIFLDGLHVFEQTMRDFCNSLTHIHQNSIIVIDDTVPCDPYSALRDQREAARCRPDGQLARFNACGRELRAEQLFKLGPRTGLHPRRNFLAAQFEKKIGHSVHPGYFAVQASD